jgi:lipopolysaccharide export system permease protein
MRILDRYINTSIITIFVTTVFTFTILYVMIDVVHELDDILERKIPILILWQYYAAFFPLILVQTSSISCLISVLFTFSGLNNSNEVIAMRSSGLNFWQITRPALIFGLVVSALVFYMSERLVPNADKVKRQIRMDNMMIEGDKQKKEIEKVRDLTFYGFQNRLFYIDTFDPNTNEIHGITILEYDSNINLVEKTIALRGIWTGIAWKFFDCQITSYAEATITTPLKVKIYKEKLMEFQETPKDLLKQQMRVSSMNILELKSYLDRFSQSGAKTAINNLKVDFYHKMADPIGNFIIVLLGLPFALMVKARKGMTFVSFGIAIAIGFLYYVATALSLAFGKGGILPPIMAAWLVPVVFTGLAFYFIESNFSN